MLRIEMRTLRTAITAAALVLAATPLWAAPPIYHGALNIRPASGPIDAETGVMGLTVKRWTFRLDPGSDGVFPAEEQVLIALGDIEQYVLPAGFLEPNAKGNRFTYENPLGDNLRRGIKWFRAARAKDETWKVAFKLVGVAASRLTFEFPVCEKMAVIIGDDDGFSGVELTRPGGLSGSRVKLKGACDDVDDWPWL
jgi:hypothetical protein